MKPLRLLAAALLGLTAAAARAEVPEVRIARQFSIGFMQLNVMEHEHMIQKQAARLGIPDVKVTGYKFNGPAAMNDALLSDSIDIASSAPPALFFLWSRTRNTQNEIRALGALGSMTYQIVARDPAIKTVADLDKCGKIAVASVKTSTPAILIQAAAAKAFGLKEYARFDSLTVTMQPPDAMAMLFSGIGELGCSFAVQPYMKQMLDHPGIHTVLDAYDVWGGPSTYAVLYASARFRNSNPKLYQAVYNALNDATDLINRDVNKAVSYWIEDSESKFTVDYVSSIASAKDVTWTTVPQRTMDLAKFMHDVGTLKVMPNAWTDYFFPEAHGMPGS